MAPNAPPPPGGPKSKTPMIIGGIIFLLILLVIGYKMMSKGPAVEASAGGASMASTPPPPPMTTASTTTAAATTTAPVVPAMPALSTLNTAAAYVGPSAGSTYPGNDLGNFSNADPNFCADKCNNTPGCIGFTVDTSGQGCYLKSKFDAPVASTTTNAYTKPGTVLPDGAAKYQPPITGHFIGNELGSFANIDPNFCAAKCNSTQGCVAFETDATNCTVKSQLTNPIDTSNPAIKVYKKTGVTPIDPDSVTKMQTIQAEPLEIGIASKTFAVAPTGYSTQTAPTFTMTMDLWVQAAAPKWRNIFNHGPVSGGECCGGPQMRKPAMYITGNDAAPANRIHVCMNQAAANDNTNIVTQAVVAPATWTKVAIVVSGGSMSVYVNGTLDPAGTVTGNFVWPSPDQPWTWMTPQYLGNAYGSVQVRNAFFWPFALTAAQVGAVTPTSSSAALPTQALPVATVQNSQATQGTGDVVFYSNNPSAPVDIGELATKQAFDASKGIIKRTCTNCVATHAEIYYVRKTTLPAGTSIYKLMTNVWASAGNMLGVDFDLYSTLADARAGTNAWKFCNYDDVANQVGAFRDCAPGTTAASAQWFSNKPGWSKDNSRTVTFSVVGTDGSAALTGSAFSLPGYVKLSGLDFPNNDLANFPNSDVAACSTACNARDDCKGFVVATDSQNCWLKGSFGPSVASTVRPTYVKAQQSIIGSLFGGNKVTLYADCNWSGGSVSLPPGAYPDLVAAGFYANALSAVRVPQGRSITVFEKPNFGGQALTIQRDEGCFLDQTPWFQNGWWNDKTNSVIIS